MNIPLVFWRIIVRFNYWVKLFFFVRVERSLLPSNKEQLLKLSSPRIEIVQLQTCLNFLFLHNWISGKFLYWHEYKSSKMYKINLLYIATILKNFNITKSHALLTNLCMVCQCNMNGLQYGITFCICPRITPVLH